MEGEIDRRVARTRRALYEALIRLIKRKGYAALTVQEIIDEADIGRATFYAHYRGKDDLLRGGFERLRGELKAARREARQGRAGSAADIQPRHVRACLYLPGRLSHHVGRTGQHHRYQRNPPCAR
jgi:AcrR family transcriptional regulator